MKILISVVAYDEGKSGIADYINSIVSTLCAEHSLDLLIQRSDAELMPVKHNNIHYRYVPEAVKQPFLSMMWHLFILPFILRAQDYNLIILPAGNRRLLARYPWHTVVTFHDLAQYHIPCRYDALHMFYIRYVIPHYLRKAPHILAISENTKNDLIKHYHLPIHRIEVNYNGYNPGKLESNIGEDELRSRYNLEKEYILYTARIEHPAKNHLNLIKAYEMLPDEIRERYDLVMSGSDWSGAEAVHRYAEQSSQSKRIRFLGFVDSPYLGALYRQASLYVFPSFYEGFGIPLLEAMHCGVPVICSNRSSLPEIGADAVLTFNPYLPADIAGKMLKVMTDDIMRMHLIAHGLQRVKQFGWALHTEKLLEYANACVINKE